MPQPLPAFQAKSTKAKHTPERTTGGTKCGTKSQAHDPSPTTRLPENIKQKRGNLAVAKTKNMTNIPKQCQTINSTERTHHPSVPLTHHVQTESEDPPV